jgi:hypothetical protein
MTDSTIPIPFRAHNKISFARKQHYLYTREKSLETKRDITLCKFFRLQHDNILSSYCPGLISQIYLTTQTLIAGFSVGQLPHLG